MLNRLRGPFNISTPAQAAGEAALADTDHSDWVRDHNTYWMGWFRDRLEGIGLHAYPSVGNFVLVRFPDEPQHNAAAADQFLRSRGIIVRRVDNYGLPQCLRVTIGRDDEMRALVAALLNFIA